MEGLQRLAKALGHPLRVQLLQVLGERVASPIEMSNDLAEPLGTVSYHVNVLHDSGWIEEVRNEPRRGALEHFYKAKPDAILGSRNWQEVPSALRQSLMAASLDLFISQGVAALRAGTFERRAGSSLSWQPLSVDEQGWEEIVEILEKVDARFQAVAKRSRRRLKEQNGISVVVVFGAFEASGQRKGQ